MARAPRLVLVGLIACVCGIQTSLGDDRLPLVPDGFVSELVAKEPLVRNPCVLAFDRLGRIFVGQGPQWRAPKPDTPGDRVDILIDDDGDGVADRVKTFAEGFNCIQGLAWYGRDLWVANAPDLTVVRDLDGDDEADEYVRVYTGLGNLEHALHGLNFGPDGKLYMSKGNSKGYNRLDQLAPKPFRELWGLPSPEGAPDFPPAEVFKKSDYRRKYHTPPDDWGRQGGILRCDPDGTNLEIVARGFRNPWDIAFDDGFDWLGTDNDQTQGDKIFAPFYGAHFGWGHAWSYHWTGLGHLPTVPASAPLFEGSGAGVVHYHADHFPPEYAGVFFVNDWMRREVYLFRPTFRGGLMVSADGFPPVFAHAGGGRSLPGGSGRVFAPTDIEVGPDGALYVLSWSHGYGARMKDGRQTDAGRVYRIRHATRPLTKWQAGHRTRPHADWSLHELFADLSNHVPTWRVDAQRELIRRGQPAAALLRSKLNSPKLTKAAETWTLWTLGRLAPDGSPLADQISHLPLDTDASLNSRIQALRILAFRARRSGPPAHLPDGVRTLLGADNARLRHEAVQAIWQSNQSQWSPDLLELAAKEQDRVVFYSTWNALRQLAEPDARRSWLKDDRPGVRLASLLGLAGDGALSADDALALREDPDARVAQWANHWLKENGHASRVSSSVAPPTQAGGFRTQPFVKDVKAVSGRAYRVDWTGLAAGKHHYTDRHYRITSVPPSLVGVPFIQTANNDDRLITDRLLSFTSDHALTVMVGVDARVNAPLAWMKIGQPDGFTDTGLELVTNDPTFRLYAKQFPAGRITLGGNLNRPNDSRRGNYIVLLSRPLLKSKPSAEPVTLSEVIKAMDTADPRRGRELFLHPQGAGCFRCHRMESRGNAFAPDLSDLGARATPEVIALSILKPSEVITEGFSQQVIATKDGQTHVGIVLQESALEVRLALADARVLRIGVKSISDRRATTLSAMPDGYAKQMSAQQLADIVAWLKTKKPAGDVQGFSFRDEPNELHIHLGKQRIATYLKRHPKLTRRALVNVTTPTGVQVTRNFPPRKPDDIDPGYGTEQGVIHPVMHPGIWIGFGDVDGNDYWRLRSKVVFDKFVAPPTGDRTSGSFAVRNRFLSRDGFRTVCTEVTRYRFQRVDEGVLMLIDATYQSNDRAFYFGDQEESGLAVRVASPLRVRGGNGTILNDRGERNGGQVWGKEAKWSDYFGTIAGRRVGVMVTPDPRNPRPSWLHARDYGVIVTNPFPKQPKERREPYVKTPVRQGQPYRLGWAVLIHDTPADQTFDRDKAYRKALDAMTQWAR